MLILLDIDGVMVPAKAWKSPEALPDGFSRFSNIAARALQKIITETNAAILLTTSHKSTFNLKEWENIFKERGITAKRIGRLPDNIERLSRKEEISNWYFYNPHLNFVIIDDDKQLNALPAVLKDRLVLTSGSIGLTDTLADDAIKILKSKEYSTI